MRHGRVAADVRLPNFSEPIRRNALGLIPVYNLLPESIAGIEQVSSFQTGLQYMLKTAAVAARPEWEMMFSPRVLNFMHPLRLWRQQT